MVLIGSRKNDVKSRIFVFGESRLRPIFQFVARLGLGRVRGIYNRLKLVSKAGSTRMLSKHSWKAPSPRSGFFKISELQVPHR